MKLYGKEFIGEFLGTFLMMIIGTGVSANAVLFHSNLSIIEIGLMWGVAVSLSIYVTRHLSCAHFNPAVTICMAVFRRLELKKVPVYLLGQFLGAFSAAMAIYGLYSQKIRDYELQNHIIRGSEASKHVARMFGEYYWFPDTASGVTMPLAMTAEAAGTFLLILIVFSLTEKCNLGKPNMDAVPVMIGLTVAGIICLIGPLTQAGLNPARDFAPRMAAYLLGWGKAAFPDAAGGFFWVYMLSPVLGGLAAGLIFTKGVARFMEHDESGNLI